MNHTKVKSLLAQLKNAHKVRMVLRDQEIDLSVGFLAGGQREHPVNNVMFASWQDRFEEDYTYYFNETCLDNAEIVTDTLVMKDLVGNEVILKLYPKPIPITLISNW